ncbi:ARP9 [Candida pseudojiufengensis]|uniref:ARP9 n=1 Tax=Candida pseudojiufengensis TaxID=497109 RepID=UPI00222498BC|nr:ARP9 [Candida pseudojiufengensis]KAI5959603.1 ARP9 [Candida pseudojiufengensis]
MPLYKEDNFLIINLNSQYTYFSFGLKDSLAPPQFTIPTVVYQDSENKQYLSTESENTTPIYPIRESKIVDLDAFNALIKIILSSVIQQHPIVTITSIPLLIIAPSLTWSRKQIEYITKYLFESLEITAFNILDLSLASTFSFAGIVNSVVVYAGEDSIQIVPVLGYQSIKFASKYITGSGGKTITEELKIKFPNFNDEQIEELKISGIFEFLLEGEESIGEIDVDMDDNDDELDVAKLVTEQEGNEDENQPTKSNKELEKNFFIDPTNQEKVWLGKERFTTNSKIIDIIASGIYQSLLKINDLEKRQDCYDNIILVGSIFQIPGLKQLIITRLINEYLVREPTANGQSSEKDIGSTIAKYQQTDVSNGDADAQSNINQVPYSIKLCKLPDYFPEWKKPKNKQGSWHDCYFLGGEIYAKQIFSGSLHHHNKELFVSSEMYEERGPQSIWDVSI